MRKVPVGPVLAVVFFLAASPPLLAQQGTSEISGRVTDEQAAILPGVSIVVTNEATGVFREVTTGDEGTYLAAQLVPGRYRVVARLPCTGPHSARKLIPL